MRTEMREEERKAKQRGKREERGEDSTLRLT
jgi:hypothetical protein